MNILIIDENCNAVDLASHLANMRQTSDRVVLSTDSIDTEVWATEGLRFCPLFNTAEQAKLYVDSNAIDVVCNFNSFLANTGLVTRLEQLGVRCVGTDQSFARTEYSKGYFKRWLLKHRFPTAAMITEAFIDDVEKQADDWCYPLVIKPDIQTGPSTRVCQTAEDLKQYVREVSANLGAARKGVIYLLEEYIEPLHVISFEYYLVARSALIEVTSSFHTAEKGQCNALGITFAQAPFPQYERYEKQCLSLLSALQAETASPVRGHLEAIVDRRGNLFFMENNARPPACMIWRMHIKDPWALMCGLANADASRLATAFTRPGDDPNRSIVTPLLQLDGTIRVDLDVLKNLDGVEFFPYSIEIQQGQTVASAKRMPSLLSATSTSFETSRTLISAAIAEIKDRYDFCWQ